MSRLFRYVPRPRYRLFSTEDRFCCSWRWSTASFKLGICPVHFHRNHWNLCFRFIFLRRWLRTFFRLLDFGIASALLGGGRLFLFLRFDAGLVAFGLLVKNAPNPIFAKFEMCKAMSFGHVLLRKVMERSWFGLWGIPCEPYLVSHGGPFGQPTNHPTKRF